MSEWFAERTGALIALRRAQTRVVTRLVPDIASEPGAAATPSVLHLDGLRGGRYVGQRVRVERTVARFDEARVFATAEAEWNVDGDAYRLFVPKRDSALRLDLACPAGDYHSITLLHAGRVLQLTSFSRELDVPGDAADGGTDGATGGGADAPARDDPFSADTLASPPDLDALDALDDAVDAGAADDPRPASLLAEEREQGPDYGYRLRAGAESRR